MVKKFYRKISKLISGSDTEFNVDKRLFNIALFIAVTISLISIVINLQLELPEILHYIIGTGTLILTFIYIRSRVFKKFHINLFIAASLVILSGTWLYNEGPLGSINFLYILAFIIFLSITNQKKHVIISLILFGNLIILYLVYFLKPEWVHPYATPEIRESDLLFTYTYVIIFASLIFSSLRRNYENEKNKVEEQKYELVKQHKHITDSILYARDIQQAMMQDVESVKEYFTNYFVFLEPKDIVSGDFYSFKKLSGNPNKVVCAVSDCTGHGVPGALITMLGLSFFNEIILQENNITASELLHLLREKIKYSLQQGKRSNENRDGMDMAICIIDKQSETLEFAGANRPLYIIRDNELLEYKPNRMPIGVHFKDNKPFDNKIIKLKPNDSIYLFTDGFADQFGYPDTRKFYISNLKKLLLKNADKPMNEQGEIIKKAFIDWKNTQEQTDDVLIIGIKPI
ncbi:MAG: SpoIIE family protein phosphatase [Salinivirgaceae bacterium]|nr:SpoIIE family protein phosphatase [Salinivirgaceae bacterium]